MNIVNIQEAKTHLSKLVEKAAQGVAEGVRGRLVVPLHEEDLAYTIGGQRAVLVGVERLLVFDQRRREVSLGYLLLSAQHSDTHGKVRRALQQPVLGVDLNAARATERLDRVVRVGA